MKALLLSLKLSYEKFGAAGVTDASDFGPMEESEGAPAEEGKEGTCGEEEKDGKDETRAEEEGAGEARVIVCSSRTYVSVIFFLRDARRRGGRG